MSVLGLTRVKSVPALSTQLESKGYGLRDEQTSQAQLAASYRDAAIQADQAAKTAAVQADAVERAAAILKDAGVTL